MNAPFSPGSPIPGKPASDPEPAAAGRPRRFWPSPVTVRELVWAFLLVDGVTLLCWFLLPHTDHYFAGLAYLLAIVLAGTRWGRGPVLTMAALSAVVWHFLFIAPRFALHVDHPREDLMFITFAIVALCMGHLTTQLRAREEALERHHREREAFLAERHRADLLEESERLYRILVDSVSHELKTPIAIIRTALDGLDSANPYAAEIETANRRLQRIVELFLDMSRVESETLQPRADWCEAGDVLHAAAAPLEADLAGRPLRVTGVSDLPLIRLDSRLLAQALGIVLHNATQYTPPGSPIEIHVSLPDPGTLALRVRDHGPGLPAGDEARVFEKFYRSPGSPAGGTGLGLAIAQGLLKALRGDIQARSHPEGGAEFTLRAPVTTRTTAPPLPS